MFVENDYDILMAIGLQMLQVLTIMQTVVLASLKDHV